MQTETAKAEFPVRSGEELRNKKQKSLRRKKIRRSVGAYLYLGIGSIIMLYPLYFMLVGALLNREDFYQISAFPWPSSLSLENFGTYLFFFSDLKVLQSIALTLGVIAESAAIMILSSVVLAYIFSFIRFRFRGFIFMAFLAVTMIPGAATVASTFVMWARFPFAGGNNIFTGGSGFIGDPIVLFLININISPMNIFLYRQAFCSIGKEIGEAAEVDGANLFTVMFRIYLPLILPVLAYSLIGLFIGKWNDYSTCLYLMKGAEPEWTTIGYYINIVIEEATPQDGLPNYPLIYGVSAMMCLVPIVIFAFFQRWFIDGLSMGALKG